MPALPFSHISAACSRGLLHLHCILVVLSPNLHSIAECGVASQHGRLLRHRCMLPAGTAARSRPLRGCCHISRGQVNNDCCLRLGWVASVAPSLLFCRLLLWVGGWGGAEGRVDTTACPAPAIPAAEHYRACLLLLGGQGSRARGCSCCYRCCWAALCLLQLLLCLLMMRLLMVLETWCC